MTLLLVVGLMVGFVTGQSSAKKELIKDKAYFCYVEENTKRCYDVKEDPYGRVENYNSKRF
jgi:hypothetical protein